MDALDRATRYLFFTGKGGVGKTSVACATAIRLADRGSRVLLVSTDPASNLEQVLEARLGLDPTPIPGVERLDALNIDPEAAAQAYRERALAPLLGIATETELTTLGEELSGACTVEIAAFDEFTTLLAQESLRERYDHVVFDTAPTGHTLRLLALPAAWSSFIAVNRRGASCLGPANALKGQQASYQAAVAALTDPEKTTLVLVARPNRPALDEAAHAAAELRERGMVNQELVINGVFHTSGECDDDLALALEHHGEEAMTAIPMSLRALPRLEVPLRPFNVVGLPAIRALLADGDVPPATANAPVGTVGMPPLATLIDELSATSKGLILVMGKGGVGKTTLASAIAVELASRGHSVHLTTTDPAAHVASNLDGVVPNLEMSRIDPAAEVQRYIDRAMTTKGAGLDEAGKALLLEDLRSPCTEEVAVFHAFSRTISKARSSFVVIDTAPTGHSLMLLDATGAYHFEVIRSLEQERGLATVTTPLMRLRDPAYSRVLIATLAEATPVQEAAQLQEDLRRAGIEPFAWIVNSSLAAASPRDPLLMARAAEERPQLERVAALAGDRAYLVPWLAEEPIGAAMLRRLASAPQLVAR